MRKVEVVWRDAVTYGEPFKMDEVAERAVLAERTTTGYLLHQDDERIILAQTLDKEDDEVDDVIVIPAPWRIRRPRKRRK